MSMPAMASADIDIESTIVSASADIDVDKVSGDSKADDEQCQRMLSYRRHYNSFFH
jgi:hypothetical protein